VRWLDLNRRRIMTKFVLLYSGGGMADTEAQRAATLHAWGAWFGKLGSALIDGGNPFTPMAKKIAADGAVSDMSGAALSNNGYSILSADSLDAAVQLARGCPLLADGGQIAVHETLNVM